MLNQFNKESSERTVWIHLIALMLGKAKSEWSFCSFSCADWASILYLSLVKMWLAKELLLCMRTKEVQLFRLSARCGLIKATT